MTRLIRENQLVGLTWVLALLAFGFPRAGQAAILEEMAGELRLRAPVRGAPFVAFEAAPYGRFHLVPGGAGGEPGTVSFTVGESWLIAMDVPGEPQTMIDALNDLRAQGAPIQPFLTDEQEALLGCGVFYGTQCDIDGIDLMNMEGSAQIMSWPLFEGTTFEPGDPWLTTDASRIQPGTVGFEGGPVCTRYEDGETYILPGCRGRGAPGNDPDVDGTTTGEDTEGSVGDGFGPSGERLHPFTGQPWANEMAIVSWNLLMTYVALSIAPDELQPGDPGITYFDPDQPFRTDGCSFANPLLCSNVAAALDITTRAPEEDPSQPPLRRWIWEAGAEYLVTEATGDLEDFQGWTLFAFGPEQSRVSGAEVGVAFLLSPPEPLPSIPISPLIMLSGENFAGVAYGIPGPSPVGSYPSIHIDDDPLFGGHHQLDEDVDGASITGEFVVKGNGDIEGDFEVDIPLCDLRWRPVNGSVWENWGVIRLKMTGPVTGNCGGKPASGKIKIKGELDSNGDFGGTVLVKACAQGQCESSTEPFFFALGDQHGGPWQLKIKDVVEGEGTTLSGKCTLKLDGSAKADWLKFDLTGTYDDATGTSTLTCKGKNSFSEGAKIKLKKLVAIDGEIVSGRIVGEAFGQLIDTHVPDAGGPGRVPALVESDPAAGATNVPRTAWLDLRFEEAVPSSALESFVLACSGAPHGIEVHAVEPRRIVVNPAAKLPTAASCELRWAGLGGGEGLSFNTAAAGVPGTVLYDRTDDGRLAPFPDDYFLTLDASTPTGFRVAVPAPTSRPTDVRELLDRLLNQTDELDGWSPLVLIQVDVTVAPDAVSLPMTAEASLDPAASVGLFDLTPGSNSYGERIPFLITLRSDQVFSGPFGHSILIFPSIPLASGGRYGLVVTDRVRIDAARPFEASSFFRVALSSPAPGEAEPVTRVRELATGVLDAIAAAAVLPIPADDAALALSLQARTTDDLPNDVLAMKEQILAAPPPEFNITSVQPSSGSLFAVVSGTWQSPNWLSGLSLARDEDGKPVQTGTIDIPFTVALPRAIEDGPVPAAMYQHGNPGSPAGEVPYSDVAGAGFATFGSLDFLNREIGGSEEQNLAIFGLLQLTGLIADFWTQTRGEQLAFLHLIQAIGEADSVDDLPSGAPPEMLNIDASRIVYEGVSEGGNLGQAFLAYAPEVQAAAIIVGGERLTEVLIHQDRTDPDGIGSFFFEEIPDFVPNVTPTDIWTGLSIFQMRFDPQDPQNHARFIYRDPIEVAGTTGKASILVVEGIEDNHVPNNATDSLAWLLGIPQLPPVARRVPFLTEEDAPATANIDPQTTGGMVQYVPAGVPGLPPSPDCESSFEGHFCAQSSFVAVQQRQAFYQSAVNDPVPTIPPPDAP